MATQRKLSPEETPEPANTGEPQEKKPAANAECSERWASV